MNPGANLMLSQEQQQDIKRMQEEKLRKVGYEYRKMKEELMKQFNIIEIATLKIDPVTGIVPDAAIIPHTWAEGESWLPQTPGAKPIEKKPEEKVIKKDEPKAKKTK